MPEIPVTGFVLQALGAVALALMLGSLQGRRPRFGVRDWSLGLWCLAAALLVSLAASRAHGSPLRTPILALAVVLAYWSPALVLLGTWSRWNDRPPPRVRGWLLGSLAAVGLVTTFTAPLLGGWGPLVRAGTRSLATMAAHLGAGIVLLRGRGARPAFGPRVLAVAFLGAAAEDLLFVALVASAGRVPWTPGAQLLIEVEMVLLMLTGVGMIAWLLEEEREWAVKLQEALHRKEALSTMGALVGAVAHEVRNPLFGLSANLDALAARLPGDGPTAALVAAMREEVRRLNGLMTDLLDYGRPIASELTRQSVSTVVGRAIASCVPALTQACVSVALEEESTSDVVAMDEPRLQQVFQNLVENAVQHAPRGGRVRVVVRAESHLGRTGVRCAVHDPGPGFDPAHLPFVFEPFFSRRRGGTGLGLSIVERIVQQHSGHVEAGNHPAGGGVVSVWLPGPPPAH
jgi:signal transduction histidine kinase